MRLQRLEYSQARAADRGRHSTLGRVAFGLSLLPAVIPPLGPMLARLFPEISGEFRTAYIALVGLSCLLAAPVAAIAGTVSILADRGYRRLLPKIAVLISIAAVPLHVALRRYY